MKLRSGVGVVMCDLRGPPGDTVGGVLGLSTLRTGEDTVRLCARVAPGMVGNSDPARSARTAVGCITLGRSGEPVTATEPRTGRLPAWRASARGLPEPVGVFIGTRGDVDAHRLCSGGC